MDYRDRLLKHLVSYRRSSLGITEPGVFVWKGKSLPCDHALARGDRWMNLLEPFRDAIRTHIEASNGRIKPHKYFHHLNSSQALALNLFFPFFVEPSHSEPLMKALGLGGIVKTDSWVFEDVPDEDEESNLDATWETSEGTHVICEVKLTETGFGKAPADSRHLRKLRDTYRPRLEGVVPPSLLEPDAFFARYQVLRNVWHLLGEANRRLIFLLPRENETAWSELQEVYAEFPKSLGERINIRALEAVVEDLMGAGLVDPIRSQIQMFKGKYILEFTEE